MALAPDVRAEIIKYPDLSDVQVYQKMLAAFKGQSGISLTAIRQVRSESERVQNIEVAQTEASQNLNQHNQIIIDLQTQLLSIFNNPALTMKEKMEASKELRAWTKMGIDSAGSALTNGGTTFVFSSEWDVG